MRRENDPNAPVAARGESEGGSSVKQAHPGGAVGPSGLRVEVHPVVVTMAVLVVVMAAVVVIAGCATRVRVNSDTTWTGFINGASVAGAGVTTYQLAPREHCAVFAKGTEEGFLAIRVEQGWWKGPFRVTRAPFGAVMVCDDP